MFLPKELVYMWHNAKESHNRDEITKQAENNRAYQN